MQRDDGAGGETGALAVSGGTLIDVPTGDTVPESVILIEGERIARVGRATEILIPDGTRVVDARGTWIIPGLADMHAHISQSIDALPLDLFLANGVTTIRDPGGNLTQLRLAREAIDSGRRLGPRLFFAGQILDGMPPVWPALSLLADTPERAESAVTFLADQGVDCIKVYNHISEAALVAIVRTAHARDLPVIGHVPRALTMTRAVELGMDCLEHIRITGREVLPLAEANAIDFLPLGQRETLLWQRFDPDSGTLRRIVATLAERQIFLDPTLTIDEDLFVHNREGSREDPNNRFLPRELRDEWVGRVAPALYNVPPELIDVARAGFTKRQRFVRLCGEAGVPLVAGTDGVGLGRLLPGFGLQHELSLLLASGVSPLNVIRAATITAARALRREAELGSVEAGKLADLVLLGADPLADGRALGNIRLVIMGGRTYDPAALLRDRETDGEALTPAGAKAAP